MVLHPRLTHRRTWSWSEKRVAAETLIDMIPGDVSTIQQNLMCVNAHNGMLRQIDREERRRTMERMRPARYVLIDPPDDIVCWEPYWKQLPSQTTNHDRCYVGEGVQLIVCTPLRYSLTHDKVQQLDQKMMQKKNNNSRRFAQAIAYDGHNILFLGGDCDEDEETTLTDYTRKNCSCVFVFRVLIDVLESIRVLCECGVDPGHVHADDLSWSSSGKSRLIRFSSSTTGLSGITAAFGFACTFLLDEVSVSMFKNGVKLNVFLKLVSDVMTAMLGSSQHSDGIANAMLATARGACGKDKALAYAREAGKFSFMSTTGMFAYMTSPISTMSGVENLRHVQISRRFMPSERTVDDMIAALRLCIQPSDEVSEPCMRPS